MLTKAIEEIKSEMDQNKNNAFIQAVGGFLLQHLNECPGEAEKILAEGKTMAKSLDEMKKAAEKKKIGNYAVLTDQEGFEIVLKYYGIEAGTYKLTIKPAVKIPEPVPEMKSEKKAVSFDVNLDDLL